MVAMALVYRELAPGGIEPRAAIIALHDEGGDGTEVVSLLSGLVDDCLLVVPKAWRSLTPRMFGDEEETEFAWFYAHRPDRPEPATFGDCLYQVEQFVHDVRERVAEGVPILIMGWGQGASIAITMAGIIPDYLDGVVAFDGFLPTIDGWELPSPDSAALPIALAYRASSTVSPALRANTEQAFVARQASVTVDHIADGDAAIRDHAAVVLDRLLASSAQKKVSNAK